MTDLDAPLRDSKPLPVVSPARHEPAPRPLTPTGRRNSPWWVRPVLVYGLSRIIVLIVAAIVAARAPEGDPQTGPWPHLHGALPRALSPLGRWDAAWYASVTLHGYPGPGDLAIGQKRLAFFPLFPLVCRAVSAVTPLSAMGAGIVVSVAAGALAVLLIWKLVAELSGAAAADRASAVLCFFPGAVVLSMAYSEGLLLAGTAATMLFLRRRRWAAAGLAAALTTLSRPNAVAVVAMCAVAAAIAVRDRRDWRAVAAPLLAPLGTIGFFAVIAVRTGWPLAWFRAQRDGWRDSLTLDGAVVHHVHALWSGHLFGMGSAALNPLVGVIGLAVIAGSGHLLWRWRPPSPLIAYTVVSLALALASARVGARPRMVLAAFPLLLAVGVRFHGRAHVLIIVVSAVLSCVAAALLFGSLAMTP